MIMTKIGDVFEIPLSDGRKAYGQLVFRDKKNGPLIIIFNKITKESILDVKELINIKPLFPPVITGLNAAIRTGMWRIIGKFPINDFVYPKFVNSDWNQKSGKAIMWYVWDGEKDTKIGPFLPDELKNLEFLVVWSPYDVVYRIETGEYPSPYGDLIKFNKFSPRREDKPHQ